jgi:hypothetical protein
MIELAPYPVDEPMVLKECALRLDLARIRKVAHNNVDRFGQFDPKTVCNKRAGLQMWH